MDAFIEGIKWVLLQYGVPTLILGATIGLLIWIIARNSGTDTLKTVNSLMLLNGQQLAQLQADFRDVTAKYIELLKQNGESVSRAMLADNKLQNFMVLSESNKAEWLLERDGLKKDIEELKQQVKELLALVKVRDEEIKDLKEDNSISEVDKEI